MSLQIWRYRNASYYAYDYHDDDDDDDDDDCYY